MANKSQKAKMVNKETMVVGLDIGKRSHYGYFRAPDGQDSIPFEFHNHRDSFNQFWQKLCRFKSTHGLKEVLIGFESTGPYAEPILHFLRQQPVKLVQINPMHTKRVKELTGNSPNKTDRKDPRVIADVMLLGHSLTVVVPEGAAAHLRRLTQARERAVTDRTAMLNQLQHLLFVIFPEFLRVIKTISSKTGLYLAGHCPTPDAMAALGLAELSRVIKAVSCGRIGAERADQLFQAARSSVGIAEGRDSIVEEIGYLVARIEHANAFIVQLEGKMRQHLEQIPYSGSLLSLRGIGVITAAGLIGEVGDFRKFSTISEITKLAGLDLFEVSSGKLKGQRHISKRGRSLMRKLLYFAAINTVRSNGVMRHSYARMIERGMPKMKALVAISRKLLAVMFALVRDQTAYIENYDHNCLQLAA